MSNIEQILGQTKTVIDKAVDGYLNLTDNDYGIIYESMRYSSLDGGKRLRPFLMTEFYKLFDGEAEKIIPFACALEFIHTYSLIHDDLPCMDNDDYRRGKPANHKKYGEWTAMLAGDALLTYAFEIAAKNGYFPPEITLRVIGELTRAAGACGMIGGQVMDMTRVEHTNAVRLIKLYALKTGNLFMAAARIGCICGNADEEILKAATEYSKNLSIAFQITDDIFDADTDKSNTFVSLLGVDEAREYANNLAVEAVKDLEKIKTGLKSDKIAVNLKDFTIYLADRKK